VPAYYADVARAFGVGSACDFSRLGKGDVLMVINGDLEEQAPVWFLRLRQAVVDRGATLVIAHSRGTKMHRYAQAIYRYDPGYAAGWLAANSQALLEQHLSGARNALFVFGDEHLDGPSGRALAQLLANLLIQAGHVGKPESGLLPLYPHANTQGVFDMTHAVREALGSDGKRNGSEPFQYDLVWLVGVGDPADVPRARFTVVQELFLTDLAQRADVLLPALSFAEREGTFTSGDRRVQRFYRALPPLDEAKPDWWIALELAKRLGYAWGYAGPQAIFAEIAQRVPAYAGLSYECISQTAPQWPPLGREDLYYGGTVYDNTGGLGVRYASDAERDPAGVRPYDVVVPEPTVAGLARILRPLYREGELIRHSAVLSARLVPIA
jgi:NADH-quinone oxidoreductase subunit G